MRSYARNPRKKLRNGWLPSWMVASALMSTLAVGAGDASAQGQDEGSGAVPRGGTGAVVVPAEKPADAAPAKKGVQPPQLQQFVPAPYPPEAKEEGIEGNVVLQLDIDETGQVTAATVVNPAGHGFDEAAVEAAKQFKFAPALRDGKPMPARILYRYSFTLQEDKPETPGAGGPTRPQAGPIRNLAGQVRTSEGDVPIAGASVSVKDASGAERLETTGEDGSWSFTDLPPGTYKVTIKAPGYQELAVDEQVAENEITEVVYRVAAEGALEVIIRGKRPPREVTKRTLEKREIEKIPGTAGDALRSIQNLPGVARPPGLAGLLIVRGSAPGDTEVFIDGIIVPLVYHFGGLSSVVPTELLDRIDFYPGNFSTQYGRVLGGIVDVGIRSPKDDGKYHGMAQVDLIDTRALLEGPVPGLDGWNFAVAARRSWFDVWLKPVLTEAGSSVTAAPVYYDYQAIVETKPTDRSSLRFGFIGSNDRLEILTRDASEIDPVLSGNIRFETSFWRLFGRYENDISDDVQFKSVTGVGEQVLEFGLGTLFFELKNYPVTHRSELSYRLGRRATLHTGIDMLWGRADVNILAPQPPQPGEPDPGPFASRPPIAFDQIVTVYRPAAYMELELTPYDRLKLVPGLRVDYAKDIEGWDLSPRLNARYVLLKGYPQTTIKGGIGLFHRPPDFNESQPPFGTYGLRSNRSTHYSVGVEQDLTKNVDVSIEGFYKKQDLLVGVSPGASGTLEYNNLGEGKVIGSEMLLRYKPDDRFFGWIAYTLSRAMLRDQPGRDYRLADFDQTHILTALGSYKLGRGWEFGARYRLVSGNPETPVVGALYNANAGAYAAIDGEYNSSRVDLFHQLDLRVDKMWKFESWKLSTYLDVQNVYYSQNVEGYDYNYNYTQRTVITGLPIIPSIGLRGDF
jgi:TonB family protein